MNPQHAELISLARRTLDQLRDEDGLVLETEDDIREALQDEGISIDGVLSTLGRAALDTKLMVDMIEGRMEALSMRLKRYERREAVIRATLLQAMSILGLKFFRDPEFNAYVREGKPKIIVTDIDALPPNCVRIKREPDKTAIGWILRDHGDVPGAMLSNAESYLVIGNK